MNIKDIFSAQRKFFNGNETKQLKFRTDALKGLRNSVLEHKEVITQALSEDLGKSEFESYLSEIAPALNELNCALKNLKHWMKRRNASTPMSCFPAISYLVSEPYGTSLIFSAWNYPFLLTVAPLVSSIAAGNCTVLKPSEHAPATSALISSMLGKIYPPEYVAVIEGDKHCAQSLLKEKSDLIFFTGGETAGKAVMKAAADNLTPVILELGGKSPCIVDQDADIAVAARRICWGKFLNAGQTCVAPDYLLIHHSVREKFLDLMKKYIKEFFGENPLESTDYCRIVSKHHFQRLKSLLDSGRIFTGGDSDENSLYIAPTILRSVNVSDPVMQQEIFGPILPVFEFAHLTEAIEFVNSRPKPLALYYFAHSRAHKRRVINETSSGSVCINDVIMQLASENLPFGGVGPSGMGSYHGKFGFDTFSHCKAVMSRGTFMDVALRYPPYSAKKLKLAKKVL